MMHGADSALVTSPSEMSSPSPDPGSTGVAVSVPFGAVVRDALTATLAGDPDGPNRLFTSLRPWLLAGMQVRHRSGVPGHGDAEDLTQDICLAILRSISTYQGTPGQFLSWVYRIVTCTMADFYARRDRDRSTPTEQVLDTPDLDDGPEQHAELALLHDQLTRLVNHHLRPDYRDVLHHRFLTGLSVPETAAAMGISKGYVRVLQHRALAELRAVVDRDLVAHAPSHTGAHADGHVGEHSTTDAGWNRRASHRRPSATTAYVRSSTHALPWQRMRWSGSTPQCPTCTTDVVMADGGWSCPRCASPQHHSPARGQRVA
jgi:RNA polymerase sigma-70 factor (ECF subfamily)